MPTAAEQYALDVESVKDALASIVATQVPTAKVVKRFVFDPNEDNWAALLRNPADTDSNGNPKVHTICIYYAESEFTDPGVSSTVAAINPELPFELAFFIGHDLGTDASNSEKTLKKEVTEVTFKLAEETDLNVRPLVKGHRNLRMQKPTIRMIGEQPVHIQVGRLEVLMQSRQIR